MIRLIFPLASLALVLGILLARSPSPQRHKAEVTVDPNAATAIQPPADSKFLAAADEKVQIRVGRVQLSPGGKAEWDADGFVLSMDSPDLDQRGKRIILRASPAFPDLKQLAGLVSRKVEIRGRSAAYYDVTPAPGSAYPMSRRDRSKATRGGGLLIDSVRELDPNEPRFLPEADSSPVKMTGYVQTTQDLRPFEVAHSDGFMLVRTDGKPIDSKQTMLRAGPGFPDLEKLKPLVGRLVEVKGRRAGSVKIVPNADGTGPQPARRGDTVSRHGGILIYAIREIEPGQIPAQ
jgi:hypothetical protein